MSPQAADDAHSETDIEEHVGNDDGGGRPREWQQLTKGKSDDNRGQDEGKREHREESSSARHRESVQRVRRRHC